jgi:nucleoside-triphosphatase THEP1
MSTVQRDCICRRVNKLNKEQSLAKYFIKIHYMEDSVQTLQRKRAQHISTSTVIDEEGRFFIEIRGFNNILMDILEEMDNEKYFTIDNIQRYKQGLTQRFLSTFR